jgi:hypothetical protein
MSAANRDAWISNVGVGVGLLGVGVPAIDLTAFPGTPSTYFWTSNAFTRNPGNAWIVDFTSGHTFGYGIDATGLGPVRCVR